MARRKSVEFAKISKEYTKATPEDKLICLQSVLNWVSDEVKAISPVLLQGTRKNK